MWFPNNAGFVGQSYFETDYMMVDWVKYLPFDESQTYTPFNPSLTVSELPEKLYPTTPTVVPEINLLANGDFEYIRKKDTIDNYGWVYNKLNTEELPVEDVCFPLDGIGYQGSAGACIKNGGYLTNDIDSVYEGFKYKLKFNAKSDGDDSCVLVSYFDSLSNRPIKEEYHYIDSKDYEYYEFDTVAPVIYAMGGSIDEMYNPGKSKDTMKEISISSIKEIYEFQLAETVKMNETHINNIRSHYEQHRQDSIENYEKRLADKREIIEEKDEHIKSLKNEILYSRFFSWLCVGILIALLIAELMNPNLGWLRFENF